MKRFLALLCVILFAFSLVACGSGDPETNYTKALECLEKGDYEKAHRLLYELGDYKDAKEYLAKFKICYKKATTKHATVGSYTIEHEYDAYGNLILMDEVLGLDVIKNAKKFEYEYDETGNIVKRILYRTKDGSEYNLVRVVNYIYDADGNGIKCQDYDASGALLEEYDYATAAADNVAEILDIFDGYEFTYDDYGRVTKRIVYAADGSVQAEWEYKYDKNGNLTKAISTIQGNKDSTITESFSDFVYFYFPDGVPEVEGVWPTKYHIHIQVMNYNKKG